MSTEQRRPGRRAARLIIADDHELARLGLRSMLVGVSDLELVGEGSGGHEAVALCTDLQPDLALLDIRMPDLDGLSATRAIKQQAPRTRVLIVTTHDHPDYMLAALKAGAAGYLLKDITRSDLLGAIRKVLRGESISTGAEAVWALQHLAGTQAPADEPPVERLTPRESEVLALVVEGLTNREIAERLTISVGTAKIHVERIIAKLGVSDRTQAAVRAVRQGLVRRG